MSQPSSCSASGCVLRIAPSGERYQVITCLLQNRGLERMLMRPAGRSRSNAGDIPDILQYGEFTWQRNAPDRPAYLREFHRSLAFPQLATSFPRFQAAANLARFFELNLLHLESFDGVWTTLWNALHALSAGHHPDGVVLKALFRFARDEGYPVAEEWLPARPQSERGALVSFLRQPLQQSTATAAEQTAWLADLLRYLAGIDELRLWP
jgi:recombinational DNA repair protein (RecF pathway)